MGLLFTIAAGPRKRSHFQVGVPRDSWPHFTVSDSRLPQTGGPVFISPRNRVVHLYPQAWVPFSSPPTTRRATVKVLEPASTRGRQSQSQSYFTTGGLPSISSSWREAPWDSRPEFFFQLSPCGNSHYVTSSLTRWWVCLLWICLTFRQV
jgi:hypothetical protein